MDLAKRLAVAAGAFLAGLAGEHARRARLPFDEEERRSWAYWPVARRGVPLWSLDRDQAKAAHRLLASMLALPVYTRAVCIMGLDEVLDRLEGYAGDRRHAGDYWVSVFGDPGAPAPWSVRFEGHHVSVHATVVGGAVRLTPMFLGANPAVVRDHGLVVTAPLSPEEELGFELLHSLSAAQRAAAVVSDTAPDDILTRNARRLAAEPWPGVAVASLAGTPAAGAADALVAVYATRLPDGADRLDTRALTFAWAGADEPGVGHYYRLAGPRFLVELDNTQNDANHIHTVVRDPEADFGDDLLARHYRLAHGPPPP